MFPGFSFFKGTCASAMYYRCGFKKLQLLISRQLETLRPPPPVTFPHPSKQASKQAPRQHSTPIPHPFIKIVIYFSKSEWQLAFFSLQQAVIQAALITFVTSLTPGLRALCRENGPATKLSHRHGYLRSFKMREFIKLRIFYDSVNISPPIFSTFSFDPLGPRQTACC